MGVEVALVGLREPEEKCEGGDEEEIDEEELYRVVQLNFTPEIFKYFSCCLRDLFLFLE